MGDKRLDVLEKLDSGKSGSRYIFILAISSWFQLYFACFWPNCLLARSFSPFCSGEERRESDRECLVISIICGGQGGQDSQ